MTQLISWDQLRTTEETCSVKRRWRCKSEAKQWMRKHKWMDVRPYTCNVCGYIHITSYKKVD